MRIHQVEDAFGRKKLIKLWEPEGYPFEEEAVTQIENMARMPFIHKHVAVMPDAHSGKGSTVGTVIATKGAIIPAAVGVDIGCGMMAIRTSLTAEQLPDSLSHIRGMIESAVPHGRGTNEQIRAGRDPGSWGNAPKDVVSRFGYLETPGSLRERLDRIVQKHPKLRGAANRAINHLGSLGTGNHFIEICLDEDSRVWVMLHSGSRGIGNAIGTYFIEKAKQEMERYHIAPYLADTDLSYLVEHTDLYDDYVEAVGWAQDFAAENRKAMMEAVLGVMRQTLPPFMSDQMAVNCFRGDTRFITSEGLRAFSDVSGTTVKVITSTGRWVDAKIKSFGEQRLVKLTLSRYDLTKTIYTTAGHRWFVDPLQRRRVEKTTMELEVGDRLASQRPNSSFDGFDLRSEFRGFTFGDGSTNSAYTSLANFCGPKHGLVDRYKGLEGNEPRNYGETTRITGLPGAWKREVKDLFYATPNEIAGWLAGYFAADGDIDKTGRPTMTSADRQSLESYRDLCWRIGIATYPIRYAMRTGYGDEETPLYLMGLSRNDLPEEFFIREDHRVRLRRVDERFNWKVVAIEETDLVEEVFCAEVPETHAFVLEDGILTSNCHHNYVTRESHFGDNVWVTRKGAVQAREGTLGIIPGSMGTGSFIVEGKGNPNSFHSCSHGAGRTMSRTKAKKLITMEQHAKAMEGIEARLDADVIDESPAAYKPISAVMDAQDDLVEIKHRLRQVLNVKG